MARLRDHDGSQTTTLECVEMHVTGEPARIVYAGFPHVSGTLLEQLALVKTHYDDVRSRLILEPRGHKDMYAAILRPDTELTRSGEAHIGVLFCYNNGYSPMCGHATIALGRFLVDQISPEIFPNRSKLQVNDRDSTVTINLHAPCGLVKVVVPVTPNKWSDPTRPVHFLSTPSYAVAIGAELRVPEEFRWPELKNKESVTLDVSFGGGYFLLVSAQALGFPNGLRGASMNAMRRCVNSLMDTLGSVHDPNLVLGIPPGLLRASAYGVMLVDTTIGLLPPGTEGTETGIFFFGDGQVDRSPAGSCVSARMALAHAKGLRRMGQPWAYTSVVSNFFETGAFIGKVVEEVDIQIEGQEIKKGVVIDVSAQAFYTGSSRWIVEGETSFPRTVSFSQTLRPSGDYN